MCGDIVSIDRDLMVLNAAPFKVRRGFVLSESLGEFAVAVPGVRQRAIHLTSGCSVMCIADAHIEGSHVSCSDDAKVLFRPELTPDMPWNVTHVFSGSYCGWSQACQWLNQSTVDFRVSKELYVDHSSQAMQAWQVNCQAPLFEAPILPNQKWTPDSKVGILADVKDKRILHLLIVTAQMNHLATISPPCVSWSKGGLGRGLSCEEGLSFIQAVELAFGMNVIALECVHEFLKHPHARLVEKVLRDLGFCRTWEQVVGLH